MWSIVYNQQRSLSAQLAKHDAIETGTVEFSLFYYANDAVRTGSATDVVWRGRGVTTVSGAVLLFHTQVHHATRYRPSRWVMTPMGEKKELSLTQTHQHRSYSTSLWSDAPLTDVCLWTRGQLKLKPSSSLAYLKYGSSTEHLKWPADGLQTTACPRSWHLGTIHAMDDLHRNRLLKLDCNTHTPFEALMLRAANRAPPLGGFAFHQHSNANLLARAAVAAIDTFSREKCFQQSK